MPNQKNIGIVERLKDKISKAKAMVIVEYHGLDANKIGELRARLDEAGAELSVAKNTLLKIALGKKRDELEVHLEGPNATVFAHKDGVAAVKALFDFVKKFDLPKVKIGIVDGIVASAEKLELLSKLPSREKLLAQIGGIFKSSLSQVVRVLHNPHAKFVYALKTIAEKKEVS
ncbi:50S ribosomal protein L10 [candidate division WWE3 bacterium]|nr:50S ribosomal protein L10 [candidate division WWE3 bacterium]